MPSRYSSDDVARLLRISALAAGGVNPAGIARILELEDETPTCELRNHPEQPLSGWRKTRMT
jgi:MerR family transcriptional regulator/heat shock protein HspR